MNEEIIILLFLTLMILGLIYVSIYLLGDWIKRKWSNPRNVKSEAAPTKP